MVSMHTAKLQLYCVKEKKAKKEEDESAVVWCGMSVLWQLTSGPTMKEVWQPPSPRIPARQVEGPHSKVPRPAVCKESPGSNSSVKCQQQGNCKSAAQRHAAPRYLTCLI